MYLLFLTIHWITDVKSCEAKQCVCAGGVRACVRALCARASNIVITICKQIQLSYHASKC